MTYYFWLGKDAEYLQHWAEFMKDFNDGQGGLRERWDTAVDKLNKALKEGV